MKILFLNQYLGTLGGVEQNIADVVPALRARGNECWLAYGCGSGREEEACAARFNGVFPCPELWDDGHPQEGALATVFEQVAPTVVYAHKLPSVAVLEPFVGQARLVRMVHDHDLCCPRRHKYYTFSNRICHAPLGWRCWLDLAFLRRDRTKPAGVAFQNLAAARRELDRHRFFDALLVGSRFMLDELVENGFQPDSVRILSPCVNLPEQPATPVPQSRNLLFVGQLIKGKGVHLLLESLAHVRSPSILRIAGDGNARAGLEAQARDLGLSERVEFLGWVPRSELESLYREARALVVPSFWAEPFGMIGLEAMHHGRPVVGFAAGGIPDWLADGENGLLVAERDVAGLAAGIDRLLDDHALAVRLGTHAHELLRARFSFAAYTVALEAILAGEAAATHDLHPSEELDS